MLKWSYLTRCNEKRKRDEIIPRKLLPQKKYREADEDDECDKLLDDLELEF